MNHDPSTPVPDLPPLPAILQDELLAILFGDPARRSADVARLQAAHPQHAAALAAHLRHHEQLQARPDGGGMEAGVPGYRILQQLGEGGMGRVYLAEQTVPLVRRVALKVIKLGMDSREVVARFERERQALAVMDHDAIAKVYDCGTTPRGQPYFAMEYVPGEPIAAFADARRLALRARIELFLQVCRGVQHAHQKGVIHRDLKPGNVLVGERDGVPFVKVIDFGIARATAPDGKLDTLTTAPGQLVGTPEYMSPEQAAGDQARIDTRTDVYSLGLVLYELVAGVLPFPAGHLRSPDLVGLGQRLLDTDLPRPSTRLGGLGAEAQVCAERRQLTLTSLRRQLRADLDWIVLRATAKEPERRYPSVTSLADDLQRYLDGLPVLAGPPSPGYRLRKFARRHRGQLLAAGLLFLALLLGLLGTTSALAAVQRSQARFDLLRHVVLLRTARSQAGEVLAAWPAPLPRLQAWLHDFADPLAQARPRVQAALELPPAPGEVVAAQPTVEQFLRDELQQFLTDLQALEQQEGARVRQQRDWAAGIDGWTLRHPRARVTWQAAREAIARADGETASRRYAASPIDLQPQTELVPIGMNPVTRLWEFYHLRSAFDLASGKDPGALPIPEFRPDGSVAVDDDTGIVFVLVPGARAVVSAQKDDPTKPNYDPDTVDGNHTVEVTLAPFFLGRHELTQGQWLRLAGTAAPCNHPVGKQLEGMKAPITAAHPVEMVDWFECDALLRRSGLVLPTEAQWEYAARGGADTPYAYGRTPDCLQGAANLLDAGLPPHLEQQWIGRRVPWDDGFILHAPVGSFPKANGFGLYDVHGNVAEWCLDGNDSMTPKWEPGDGRKVGPTPNDFRGFRGGSFLNDAYNVRLSWRQPYLPSWRAHNLGCRAARALQVR